MEREYRVGLGFDSHRLEPGGPLRLGGLEIPFDHHLVGHSDADVLLHAITDAILGAACNGDIGEMFPDTDERNRGRDSAEMLALARNSATDLGFAVVNVDCVIHAQLPRSQHKVAMAERIGSILGLSRFHIGIKAKTGEGVGPVGTGQVIEAHCVTLLTRMATPRL